jgi:phosphate/sulfate permease
MAALSFVATYILMYAMVNTFDDVSNSVNQVYMAGLMTAPMVAIELVVMRRP